MQRYVVNEIFYTIQGEAQFTGSPSVFVRLHGCAVGCPWCDTKHTWEAKPEHEVSIWQMMDKTGDSPTYAYMTAKEIDDACRIISKERVKLVTVTGGEPAEQNLLELTNVLTVGGLIVQIETSGTEVLDVHPHTWVTLSPKLDMPGKKKMQVQAVARSSEIKMPIGKQADVERLKSFLDEFRDEVRLKDVWLQPLSQAAKATEICVDACLEHGWNLSMQTHKYIGVR